ncbi:flagellar protein FliT [Halomonas campisalis]|uniref:Flagellar protein FliT n=1 Tax=Billgrantia campisalis TaxID=74661 RepID=A0ABS9P490_9GAMM|nr:flagellar protein FliT [Halomonas campisalis]MCG6656219.1 flagellar protein FliT [Halomonas campisalis]MDR5861406.1 flagellar protein FliT [Halomonas campisalis]
MAKASDDGQRALIAAYTQLRRQLAEMCEQARAGDWEALLESQADYQRQVDGLGELEAAAQLDSDGLGRKRELLEAILADDRELRQRMMARRDELEQLMTASRRQRQMHRAYGRQAASGARSADSTDTSES